MESFFDRFKQPDLEPEPSRVDWLGRTIYEDEPFIKTEEGLVKLEADCMEEFLTFKYGEVITA